MYEHFFFYTRTHKYAFFPSRAICKYTFCGNADAVSLKKGEQLFYEAFCL